MTRAFPYFPGLPSPPLFCTGAKVSNTRVFGAVSPKSEFPSLTYRGVVVCDRPDRQPPARKPAAELTLHQRRVLEAWRASGDVTIEQLAAQFATTPSAICKTLRVARAKVYGAAAAAPGRKLKLISLALCLGV